jgi:hypothetical protein
MINHAKLAARLRQYVSITSSTYMIYDDDDGDDEEEAWLVATGRAYEYRPQAW